MYIDDIVPSVNWNWYILLLLLSFSSLCLLLWKVFLIFILYHACILFHDLFFDNNDVFDKNILGNKIWSCNDLPTDGIDCINEIFAFFNVSLLPI